jgi:hypothetical protein
MDGNDVLINKQSPYEAAVVAFESALSAGRRFLLGWP